MAIHKTNTIVRQIAFPIRLKNLKNDLNQKQRLRCFRRNLNEYSIKRATIESVHQEPVGRHMPMQKQAMVKVKSGCKILSTETSTTGLNLQW